MGVYALTSAVIYVGGYDLSGELSSVEGTVETTDIDVTSFASAGWHQRIAGLHDVKLKGEGFLDYSGAEPGMFPLAGSSVQTPVVLGPTTGALNEPAELFRAVQTTIGFPEAVGDAAKYKLDMGGSAQFVRGQFLGAKTSVAGSGSSSGVQIGAQTSASYAILSVFSTSTNLNVAIQAGPSAAFASSTTQIQFATTSSVGAEWVSSPTATTNQFWRLSWTGTSPAFSVAFGIKPA